MPDHRTGRREGRRAFRPTLDGRLETRVLMAQMTVIKAQTAAGGQAVVVTNTDGTRFFVSVNNGGTIRATPASQGRVNLVADGTTSNSMLEVSRIIPKQLTGTAHTFKASNGSNMPRLNIASIRVTSGAIGAIEGYQTANLSGPITVTGSTRVDRIALSSILAGGSIQVSGDLNTLDVYRDVTLNGGNISVGRDLNWFETYGNVTITNGSSFTVVRDLGTVSQPAKGSGNAGQGIFIAGNLTIDPTSSLVIGRNIPYPAGILIEGRFDGAARFTVGGSSIAVPTTAYNFFNVAVLGGGSL